MRTGQGSTGSTRRPPSPKRAGAGAGRAAAESSLAVLLGDPVFARVVPCQRTSDLCLSPATRGAPGFLAQAARDAVRWGPDSVALLVGEPWKSAAGPRPSPAAHLVEPAGGSEADDVL